MSATYCPITLTAGIRRAHEQLARLRRQHEAVLRGMKDKNLVAAHEYERQLKRAECAMASALMVEALDLEARTPKPLIVRDDLNKPAQAQETPAEAMQTAQAMLEKFHRMCPPAPPEVPPDIELATREQVYRLMKYLQDRKQRNHPPDKDVWALHARIQTDKKGERKMFNTTEPPKRENRLIELAKQDLASARDNLYRARLSARGVDADALYGQSGQSLNQIIAGYQEWEKEALEALERARKLV